MKPVTKEELVELISMAELLEERLNDIEATTVLDEAAYISYFLRKRFDEMCGEEEIKRMSEQGIICIPYEGNERLLGTTDKP